MIAEAARQVHWPTTFGWVFLITWGVGWFLVFFGGLVKAERERLRRGRRAKNGDDVMLAFFLGMILPATVAGCLLYGVFWILDGGASRLAGRLEGRDRRRELMAEEREALERRIRELEAEVLTDA